jgi:hypothetical protein
MGRLHPDPFGEDSARGVRMLLSSSQQGSDIDTGRAAGSLRMERLGRRAGLWVSRSRLRSVAGAYVAVLDFTAAATRPARAHAAKLNRSRAVTGLRTALLLAIFVGSIVYSLVTGEGNGPG